MISPETIHREYVRKQSQEHFKGRELAFIIDLYGKEAVASYFSLISEKIMSGEIKSDADINSSIQAKK